MRRPAPWASRVAAVEVDRAEGGLACPVAASLQDRLVRAWERDAVDDHQAARTAGASTPCQNDIVANSDVSSSSTKSRRSAFWPRRPASESSREATFESFDCFAHCRERREQRKRASASRGHQGFDLGVLGAAEPLVPRIREVGRAVEEGVVLVVEGAADVEGRRVVGQPEPLVALAAGLPT